MEATIQIGSPFEEIDINITRVKFEVMNKDLFLKTRKVVTNSLQYAKMDKEQIHDIVLIGGSTRIPKVQSLLQEFFIGKKLYNSIKPDEAVAYGAAVLAETLTGAGKSEEVQDLLRMEVTPTSLGIEKDGGVMEVFIRQNTTVPTKQTKIYAVSTNNHTDMLFKVYKGEQPMTKDNSFVRYLELKKIPPTQLGVIQLEVTFDIDAKGTLNVTAVEKFSGQNSKITINNYKRRLSQAEFELMVKGSENYRAEYEKQKETITAQNSLQTYCYKMWCAVEDEKLKGKISESDKIIIFDKCKEAFCWLLDNQLAEKEEFEFKKKQLKSVCNPIIKK
jgi:L1 cell adhesion molecule like protein